AIYYYVVIQKTTFEDLDKTMKAVENSEKIKEIDEVHQFYEEIGYHIFEGMNEKDEAVFLFVPIESVDDESAWKTFKKKDGQDIETVEASFTKECEDCKLHYIQPAMIEDNVLWEIVYTDESNRYVMEYVQMENGEQFERLR